MEIPALVQSLAPKVAVLSSPAVNQICRANGLDDFVELLRPFQNDIQRVPIRTTQLTTITASTFPIRLTSLQSLESLPLGSSFDRSDLILDALSSSISAKSGRWEKEVPLLKIDGTSQDQAKQAFAGKDGKPKREDVEKVTPWYKVLREIMLATRPMGEHETFEHPVAMLLAISSDDKDPMSILSAMYDHSNASKLYLHRPFIDPTVLKTFVVVHDVGGGGSLEDAEKLVSQIKKSYGPHVFLLPVSSLSPSLPPSPFLHELYNSVPPHDPIKAFTQGVKSPPIRQTGLEQTGTQDESAQMRGGRLTDVDVGKIRAFLKELVGGSLVPFMERCVAEWNETYASSRRGITGRLFGAGRKFFGGGGGSTNPSRPGSPAGSVAGYNPSKGIYPYTSPDAISRRLADFAFMLRDYRFASGVYDSIRKDYGTDKAWKYQAGATEMYGLTLLLLYPPASRPAHPDIHLQQAVQIYALRPTLQLDATRTTILYYETYLFLGEYTHIVPALMRAAGEVEEVSSAMLIEQAALGALMGPGKARTRRYAGHLVMAASRYEKSGQKTFSRRCLEQAVVLYRKQTWTKAQDHVEHSLGRQAYSQGQSEVAVDHFVRLMKGRQEGALEDFVLAFRHLQSSHPEKITRFSDRLPEPIFQRDFTVIRLLGRESTHNSMRLEWTKLESAFLENGFNERENSKEKRHKPSSLLGTDEDSSVPIGDHFFVELAARNPLDAQLILGDITIEAAITGAKDAKSSPEGLEIEVVSEVVLEPREIRMIPIKVTSSVIQKVSFTHASFRFHNLLPCRQSLLRKGKRLNVTRAQRLTPTYSPDVSLTIDITPARPILNINLEELPLVIGEGESVLCMVDITNKGSAELTDLRMMANEETVLRIANIEPKENDGASVSSMSTLYSTTSTTAADGLPNLSVPNDLCPSFPTSIHTPSISIAPGQTISVPFLCYGRSAGLHDLLLLFVYQSSANSNNYFSSTATHSLRVEPMIDVMASLSRSRASPRNQLLSVDIESRSLEPIRISQIRVLSPLWKASYPSGWIPHDDLLSANQSQRFDMALTPESSSNESSLSTAFTARKLQQLLAGSSDLASIPSPTSLLQSPSIPTSLIDTTNSDLLPLILSHLRHSKLQSLVSQYPLIPSTNLHAIFPLFGPSDVSMLVFWEISSQNRAGHVVVPISSVGPSESIFLRSEDKEDGARVVRSMFEATDNAKRALMDCVLSGPLGIEDDPVVVAIEVDSEFARHPFSQGPCRIPVNIQIHNTSINLATRVMLKLVDPNPSSRHASGFYTDDLNHQSILPPSSSTSFPATFWAPVPGVYNLSSWTLVVETGEIESGDEDQAVEPIWSRTRVQFQQNGLLEEEECLVFVSDGLEIADQE
ncbi:Protein with predicted involvement in meiosis (GSG1) [Phaffia rhodozyma]|uniref:Protein with predicted involvement in meiosis (GSG1) n=1 Tax=Phaffia rhodozyma TaxID=264483 RepID=A0A0F7SQN2_PHARH|nr:Protein with predicted involvement in meiosis (GSG1) [Phaffia rhodozyma]